DLCSSPPRPPPPRSLHSFPTRRSSDLLGRVLNLLQQLLAIADELLDGQRADDGTQRTLEHVFDDRVHLLGLGVEETLGRVAQRFDVAADLERGYALHLNLDALACDCVA